MIDNFNKNSNIQFNKNEKWPKIKTWSDRFYTGNFHRNREFDEILDFYTCLELIFHETVFQSKGQDNCYYCIDFAKFNFNRIKVQQKHLGNSSFSMLFYDCHVKMIGLYSMIRSFRRQFNLIVTDKVWRAHLGLFKSTKILIDIAGTEGLYTV